MDTSGGGKVERSATAAARATGGVAMAALNDRLHGQFRFGGSGGWVRSAASADTTPVTSSRNAGSGRASIGRSVSAKKRRSPGALRNDDAPLTKQMFCRRFTSHPLHGRAPIQIGEGVRLGADPALRHRICGLVSESRHSRLHQVRLSRRQSPCASLNLPEEIDQWLNGLDAGILPVTIGKLARQCLGDAGRGGDSRPTVRPRLFEVSLQKIEGGFHAPGV